MRGGEEIHRLLDHQDVVGRRVGGKGESLRRQTQHDPRSNSETRVAQKLAFLHRRHRRRLAV